MYSKKHLDKPNSQKAQWGESLFLFPRYVASPLLNSEKWVGSEKLKVIIQ